MNMSIGGLQKQHENWKAARERLFNPAVKAKIADIVERPAKPIIAISAPEPIKIPPLWKYTETHFDWHVRVWRESVGAAVISELAHENAALRAALKVAEIDAAYAFTERRPVKDIVAEVLEAFPGITWADIQSHHRTEDIIYPRHLCMHAVCTQRPDMSYPQIARMFGNRDHTSLMFANKKISEMTADDHRKHLAHQRKCCKKRRKYARERIMEIEALQASQ